MDNPSLEQEIQQIQKQLDQKRELLAKRNESGQIESVPHDKEILKEVLGEKIQESSSLAVPLPTAPAPSVAEPPSYLSDQLKTKVQELVSIAFQKDIQTAIKEVKRLNNPAIEDAFHDVLVDELYQELINRGIIKKV